MGASDLQRSKTGRPWKASLERKGTRPPQVFLRPGTEHVPPSGKGTRSHPWPLFYIHSLYVVYTPLPLPSPLQTTFERFFSHPALRTLKHHAVCERGIRFPGSFGRDCESLCDGDAFNRRFCYA